MVAGYQSGVEAVVAVSKKRKREEPEEPEEPEELPASTRVRLEGDLPVPSVAVKRPASFGKRGRGPAKFGWFKWLAKQAWEILAGAGCTAGRVVGLPQPRFPAAEEGGGEEAERLERMERTRAWVATQVRAPPQPVSGRGSVAGGGGDGSVGGGGGLEGGGGDRERRCREALRGASLRWWGMEVEF